MLPLFFSNSKFKIVREFVSRYRSTHKIPGNEFIKWCFVFVLARLQIIAKSNAVNPN